MYVVTNSQGMTARWITRGATLTELHVPDRNGKLVDVVLGFDDLAGYESGANHHFGCVTGRFANRIKRGRFTLDGVEYQLAINIGPNHLHGGVLRSLDKVTWEAEQLRDSLGVRFRYESPDGEEGFPGTLTTLVTYTLTDENALRIDYEATTDKPTIINLTNHSYFNLAGHGNPSVLDHELKIDADRVTEVDEESIPTGNLVEVAGTPLDFRCRHRIGDQIEAAGGYDNNYVLNGEWGTLREIAEVYEPESGRMLRVSTDQPGVQLYTANGLSGQPGKGGKPYHKYGSFCLETQNFPDAPNQPTFPTSVLRPGETYHHTCIYAFDVA
ncbi:aldose epimerase family protein [Bythopirellula polymerisocia]|uniref:Aldose 1-epimerase n=1 Tax=Bythopirellula polymerisocia TaxID=2528003 RepID=A0A5C6CLQ2_9BACT|nr:aldose epimerase family protein [Bythopirellula polymerisocia]TWU25823.1 Aldose 1-epimerase precursor [Bythopirellula polymerisocia]